MNGAVHFVIVIEGVAEIWINQIVQLIYQIIELISSLLLVQVPRLSFKIGLCLIHVAVVVVAAVCHCLLVCNRRPLDDISSLLWGFVTLTIDSIDVTSECGCDSIVSRVRVDDDHLW